MNFNADNNNDNTNTTITNIHINTTPVDSKSSQPSQSDKDKTGVNIPIWVAIISLIAAFITAVLNPELLQFFYARQATATATITQLATSTATNTLPAPSATFTFVPSPFLSATFTPSIEILPSKTPIAIATIPPTPTTHPTSVPGDDWALNCIDLTTWMPYLVDGENSNTGYCAQLATKGITAQDGYLVFNTVESTSTAKEYGIITSLPLRADIELSVNIKELKNGEVWIGVLDGDKPEQLSGFTFVIQPNSSMDFRGISPTSHIVDNTFFEGVENTFPVKIVLDAGQLSVFVDNARLVREHPISFYNRKLFIGYRLLPSSDIKAVIYNLEITKK